MPPRRTTYKRAPTRYRSPWVAKRPVSRKGPHTLKVDRRNQLWNPYAGKWVPKARGYAKKAK